MCNGLAIDFWGMGRLPSPPGYPALVFPSLALYCFPLPHLYCFEEKKHQWCLLLCAEGGNPNS